MAVKLLIQMMMLVMFLFIKGAFARNTKSPKSFAARPGCQDKCGSLNISYPFGIGAKCSATKSMEIYCNNSFNPPKAFLRDLDGNNLEVLNISLDAGRVDIKYPVSTDCTNTNNDRASHSVRLASPLTFSNNDNRFTAIGCDNLASLSSSSEYSSQIEIGGCLSRCINPLLKTDNGCFGIKCCQTKFPHSLTYVNASFSNRRRCSEGPRYAFIVDQKWFSTLNDIYIVQNMTTVPAVLNWKAFGACQTFNESDPITNGTLCDVNALCTTNQSLCSCREGFQGNPYLPNGCEDIDECALQKPCEHSCTNKPAGSFTCSCKKGWVLVDKLKCVKIVRRGKKAAIIAATATSAGAGVLVTIWWLYQVEIRPRSIRIRGEKFFKRNGGLFLQENVETTKLFTSKELETATDHYNVNRIVGQGGQRAVYKGMLTDGRIVAVKKSKIEDKSKPEHFINEVVTLSKINHRNVVKLLGYCLETEVPFLVYEFIPNGTLMQYIHEDNEYFTLTWDVRVRVATEIAGALYHLHSAAPIPIYHRDIKSTNILFDDKYIAKVADFGILASISIDQKVADLGTTKSISIDQKEIDQKVADLGTTKSISMDRKVADVRTTKSISIDQKVADVRTTKSISIDQKVADLGTTKSISIDRKVADLGTTKSISIDQKVADLGTTKSISIDQKVADLGTTTSFSIDQADLTERVQGTFGYLDPEYFQSGQFTDKSDVYSFGVVLAELLTGQKPILAATLDDEARGLATHFSLAMEENRILEIVDSRIINEGQEEEIIAFANIAYRCLNLSGKERPTMKQVVTDLESIRNKHEPPTAQENDEEGVENGINELNALSESDVTSYSLRSTIYNSLTDNISSLGLS